MACVPASYPKHPTMNRNDYTHRILLVDDSAADLKLAEQALSISDLSGRAYLQHAPNGETALSAVEDNLNSPFDAIILDLNLPRMNGKEVLKHIRPLCTETPIFIMTHSEYKSDMAECLELGADAYFVKPIDFEQLILFFSALGRSFDSDRRLKVPSLLKFYAGYAAA